MQRTISGGVKLSEISIVIKVMEESGEIALDVVPADDLDMAAPGVLSAMCMARGILDAVANNAADFVKHGNDLLDAEFTASQELQQRVELLGEVANGREDVLAEGE